MGSYVLDKYTKVCSYCGNNFFDKSGNATMCGSCATAADPQMMRDRMMQEKMGPPEDIGNGELEMEGDSMEEMS